MKFAVTIIGAISLSVGVVWTLDGVFWGWSPNKQIPVWMLIIDLLLGFPIGAAGAKLGWRWSEGEW